MPSSQHDEDHDDFAARVHSSSETVTLVRKTNTDTNVGVSRDNLKEDAKDAESDGILNGVPRLNERHEEQGQGNPPHVVTELTPDLLRDQARGSGGRVIVQGVHGRGPGKVHGGGAAQWLGPACTGAEATRSVVVERGTMGNTHALERRHAALQLSAYKGGATASDGPKAFGGARGWGLRGGVPVPAPREIAIGVKGGGKVSSGEWVAAVVGIGVGVHVKEAAGLRVELLNLGLVSFVDTQGALFVDVGLAHGDDVRVRGRVKNY